MQSMPLFMNYGFFFIANMRMHCNVTKKLKLCPTLSVATNMDASECLACFCL